MKIKTSAYLRLIVILGIFISLTGGINQETQAAPAACLWQGTTTNWYDTGNWSDCLDGSNAPTYPNDTHDVIIPAGQSAYPVLTLYQDQVDMHSLTIQSGAQITIDNQTTFFAYNIDNYGTIRIQDVDGHNLRVQSPFNNYGVVNSGVYASLILYESGTHSGSFTGKQLSFFKSTDTERINTFQAGSSIDVEIIFVDEYNSVYINQSVTCDRLYIKTNSVVDVTSSVTTHLGEVILQGGELISGTVSIPSGETFSGSGTIDANLTNAGTLSPGSSPGTINVDGDFTQESTGTLAIELGGTTAGTEYDQVNVTGAASFDGTLEITLIDDFSPSAGQTFTLMTYASRDGIFSSTHLPILDPGLIWEINYYTTSLTLTAKEGGGSISGTVNYVGNEGYNPVTIGLFTDPSSSPLGTMEVTSTTGAYPYEITGIPNGTYYVAALMDLNGNHQPDPDEPYEWYGSPTAIVISDETLDHTGIDIQLGDTSFPIYLPLILR
jgi:hypothetical protein